MRNHDPRACHLCERVPAECYRRHWKHKPKPGYWHVLADGPDLMSHLPRSAHFLTILSYRLNPHGAPHIEAPAMTGYTALRCTGRFHAAKSPTENMGGGRFLSAPNS
jgi:hypothetical protein